MSCRMELLPLLCSVRPSLVQERTASVFPTYSKHQRLECARRGVLQGEQAAASARRHYLERRLSSSPHCGWRSCVAIRAR